MRRTSRIRSLIIPSGSRALTPRRPLDVLPNFIRHDAIFPVPDWCLKRCPAPSKRRPSHARRRIEMILWKCCQIKLYGPDLLSEVADAREPGECRCNCSGGSGGVPHFILGRDFRTRFCPIDCKFRWINPMPMSLNVDELWRFIFIFVKYLGEVSWSYCIGKNKVLNFIQEEEFFY